MDFSLHRLSVQQVFDDPSVTDRLKLALRCFLKSWYGKDAQGEWMRSQHGWRDAAALLASSSTLFQQDCGGVDPYRILMCGFGRKLCERGDQCRRCALDRIDFARSEFLPAWDRASHWCAMIFALDRRSQHAGIHQSDGTLDPDSASIPVYQPFQGKPDGCFALHTGSELEFIFNGIRDAFFDTARIISARGLVGGAFAHFELSFTFWRGRSDYDMWSHIRHRVEPQLNVLVNASRPLDPDLTKEIYRILTNRLRRRLPPDRRWSYPDLWFAPVLDQKGMASWIGYMLKSWRFDQWYQEALNHRCDRRELNLCFDEIVFQNGHHLARPKSAIRRCGNLLFSPKKAATCITWHIPDPVTQEQMKLLRDENYALAHPDLAEAMFFWAEKRQKRRGQNRADAEIEY
jgi:hypothetical protein